MKRNYQPWPMSEAMPLLRWLIFLMIVGAFGKFWVLFWPSLALFIFHVAFHRNPTRNAPDDEHIWTSPADGKVTDVLEVEETKFIKGKAVRVGIFLSVFNVHTQPSPCNAKLKWVEYQPGRFHDARDEKCSGENESQMLGLESENGTRFIVKQIAGKIARRIILWRLINEEVKRGDLLGMIRYGSRVEFFIPKGLGEILVKPGDHVAGGKTPLFKIS